ncbi:hypothetical protein PR048_010198 [Dryococelus australis]|uniref:Uncharacterized protein n=1 Tax=Dryococelus australis TaxID=614101 RepID=A0ABQ9I229_9NEOP|nr:hypothetical protein PR048_010198 [Dryococelus australis]
MVPFMHGELPTLRGLFECIVKAEVIEAAVSLKNIDLNNRLPGKSPWFVEEINGAVTSPIHAYQINFFSGSKFNYTKHFSYRRATPYFEIMVGNNWLSGTVADKIKQEYKN